MSDLRPPTPFDGLDDARKKIAYEKAAEHVRQVQESAPAALQALTLEIRRRELVHLKPFVAYFWPIVEPEIPLRWNWHLDELCRVLEDVVEGRTLKVIINVPPGTMKSLLASVFLRAWIWSKDPSKRFLAGSYGGHLSLRDNVKLRTIVTHPKYTTLFPSVKLTGDQNAKEKFENDKGGWSIATSVGGVGTGEHPDFTVIDDPLTEQQSRSEADREGANNWIDRTLSTRGVTRDMRTILIMQRLHEEDPTGHLLAKGGWDHVTFPMRYIGLISYPDGRTETPDPRDQRTEKGQLLWPELFSEQKVRSLEIALGPYSAAGQLQQRPSPEGGGLFKREWFKFISASPKLARRVRGWDTAATEDGGDYTAGVKVAEHKDLFYIEHAIHVQYGPAGVEALMLSTAHEDGIECSQREEREGGSSGKTVTGARAKLLKGFDYAEVIVSKDKITRAKPLRAQCEAGNVFIVKTGDPNQDSWIEPFIAELTTFPTGRFDDQVDGASTAFNAVLLEPVIEDDWVTW